MLETRFVFAGSGYAFDYRSYVVALYGAVYHRCEGYGGELKPREARERFYILFVFACSLRFELVQEGYDAFNGVRQGFDCEVARGRLFADFGAVRTDFSGGCAVCALCLRRCPTRRLRQAATVFLLFVRGR